MSDVVKVHVRRSGVEKALADGYTFAKPDRGLGSPDGKVWLGDAVVMEISREAYEKMQEARRAPFLEVSRRIARGQAPQEPNGDFIASFSREVVTKMEGGR